MAIQDPDIRVGVGYDIHRLVEGRRLRLGGIEVPHQLGLLGHSDGDVVLHAVADALLGACCLPDIGEMFPDTDPRYAGVDSRGLLAEIAKKLRTEGFQPRNVDCIVHAERPKLSSYKRVMADSIASVLGIASTRVSVKAKTGEGLGSIGTAEAIACTAVVTVAKESLDA